MKIVTEHIEQSQQKFENHRFFQMLRDVPPVQQVVPCLPNFAFWVMAFQDALELNEARMESPEMKHVASVHRREDAGHDGWFFDDLRAFQIEPPSAQSLFGRLHRSTRHASFALLAEVFMARTDQERYVLLLTLESSGHVFFKEIGAYCASAATDRPLKYFSNFHLNVEKDHELFDDSSNDFDERVLSEADRDSCVALVDRCYRSFHQIIDGMERVLESNSAGRDDPDQSPRNLSVARVS